MLEVVRAVGETVRGRAPRCGRTRVVAIDGRSGAGKTTLAEALAADLGAPMVSLEYLYGGWDGLERGIGLLVTAVLEPLAEERTAYVPRYDWGRGTWGEPWPLAPPATLIVEGVGAGDKRAASYASTLVWIEQDSSVRKQRALERDGETFAPYWDRWAAQEEILLARERTPARADLIVSASSRRAAHRGVRGVVPPGERGTDLGAR